MLYFFIFFGFAEQKYIIGLRAELKNWDAL